MKSIINTGLQRLALNNLKITGDKNTSLLSNAADGNLANQFAADAVIEVKKCELSGMKHLCNWNGNKEHDTDRNALASFIVDDCYNANPMSMKASLDALKDGAGRRVAILGDDG